MNNLNCEEHSDASQAQERGSLYTYINELVAMRECAPCRGLRWWWWCWWAWLFFRRLGGTAGLASLLLGLLLLQGFSIAFPALLGGETIVFTLGFLVALSRSCPLAVLLSLVASCHLFEEELLLLLPLPPPLFRSHRSHSTLCQNNVCLRSPRR